MTLQLWLVYAAAVTALALTPGPNSLLALTHGGLYGTRKTAVTAMGSVCGFGLLIGLSMAGLGALLAVSPYVFDAMRLGGSLYLIYLGIKTWRSDPAHLTLGSSAHIKAPPKFRLFGTGFLVAVSNPKVILFYAAFLPQFMNIEAPLLLQLLVLTTTFMAVEWMVEVAIAAGATRVAPWLGQAGNARLFNRMTGSVFVVAGTALALSNR